MFTSKPLDVKDVEVVTKKGIRKVVPELHIGFAEEKVFVPYVVPPPLKDSDSAVLEKFAEIEEWLERMEFLEEDLHWLLKLPHNRFWCQVTFDNLLQSCLNSFLAKAPRYYDLKNFLVTDEMKGAFQRVHRLIFMTYLRMSTYKESKDSHITRHKFAELIYDCFLFDIPKMMDICTLYAHSNESLLRKMIENVFNVQPLYNDDLEKAADAVFKALETIRDKLGLHAVQNGFDEDVTQPKKLNEKSALHSVIRLSWPELEDIVMYLVDTIVSLRSFLDIYPPANTVFHILNAECRFAEMYDTIFPSLKKELALRCKDENLHFMVGEVKKRVNLAKQSVVKIFRNMIYYCCLQPMLDITDVDNLQGCHYVEDLLRIMSAVVEWKHFTCSFQRQFPFEDILDLLAQSRFPPDPAQTDYILHAIYVCVESDNLKVPPTMKNLKRPTEVKKEISNEASCGNVDSDIVQIEGATACPKIFGTELESLITQVQDLLPDMDSGFIKACLEYFNYDTEKVINGILENSLPESLLNLDGSSERMLNNPIKSEFTSVAEPSLQPEISVLGERKNVFDNDEFDVFHKDSVDTSRIHKGKKEKNVSSEMESKDDLQLMKTICNRYDITADTYCDPTLYEDEYDDGYDELAMGPEEPIEEDEANKEKVREFTIPRVLRTGNQSIQESDSEQETSHEKGSSEARDNRSAGSSREDTNRKTSGQSRFDVKGKPKGQGQDDKTLRNRSQKERHKSSYANHNRRAQSDRKRAQGMFYT